jgi:hypothetical protein
MLLILAMPSRHYRALIERAGLAQFSQQEMLATFNIAQAHLGRDAAIAMLRGVEQATARRIS